MDASRPIMPTSTPRVAGSLLRIVTIAAAAGLLPLMPGLAAQGMTTAAILGRVQATDGSDVDGGWVRVVNMATGFEVRSQVRDGRFLVQGLEIGGPYTVTLERVGFHPHRREGVLLGLGRPLDLTFALVPAAIELEPLHVVAVAFPGANAHGGTATTVPDSLLRRLPTLNRDLYDLVRLAPQVSTRIGFPPGGMSAGGAGFRFNNFMVDGVPERSVASNQPPEFAGGKSLPFEAVAELQLLVAPFDVRYGDFAGALVNAVTKSGTNRLEGTAFAYARNDALARRGAGGAGGPYPGVDPYERWQYGFSLGGPVRRDRLHFFVASELQRFTWPAAGPFVGQPESAAAVPVAESDLARLDGIMRGYGLEAGSGGPVENRNPLTNVFARLDAALPAWNTRGVLTVNAAETRTLSFSRDPREVGSEFPLSTHRATQAFGVGTAALQLHTALDRAGGGHNELFVSHRRTRSESRPAVHQPILRVTVPGVAGGAVPVITGAPRQAHGRRFEMWDVTLRDNLTLPLGQAHVTTVGVEVAWFSLRQTGVLNGYGTWMFSSLDSLEAGLASRYELARDFGSADVPLRGIHYAVYAGDRWRAAERVSVTLGLRADLLVIRGHPPYDPGVDSIFGRRTDSMPRRRVHLSPRAGFTWELSERGLDRLRGGAGVFTGRPPLAWMHAALTGYGIGTGELRCGSRPTDLGPPPAFEPDRPPPTACADGSELVAPPTGEVNLLDRRLRMAQTLRGVLAYDRHLPWDVLGTIELMATRNVSDFVFVNLNLGEPLAVDRDGRVIYGPIDPDGIARPGIRDGTFPSVVDLRNTSRNRSLQLSTRLEKRFADGLAATASYTHSRVHDVQTPLRIYTEGIVNWGSRAVSRRHDDLRPGISLNDVPHRFVLGGTYRAPWRRRPTELSLLFVSESGSPFTYLAWGVETRGDLNADGWSGNDPIYVPRNAFDRDEILMSGHSDRAGADNSPNAQAGRELQRRAAFETFIENTACLRRQRGRILERNGCREPWSHTTVASLRQAFPVGGHAVEAQLDVFNPLNLLNRRWGHRRTVHNPHLLEHVGQTPEPTGESRPVFKFDETAPRWRIQPAESSFQLQFALRYRF
jgi:hypothetical protein